MWLRNYKGRTVKDIDVNEHTKWSENFNRGELVTLKV